MGAGAVVLRDCVLPLVEKVHQQVGVVAGVPFALAICIPGSGRDEEMGHRHAMVVLVDY